MVWAKKAPQVKMEFSAQAATFNEWGDGSQGNAHEVEV